MSAHPLSMHLHLELLNYLFYMWLGRRGFNSELRKSGRLKRRIQVFSVEVVKSAITTIHEEKPKNNSR